MSKVSLHCGSRRSLLVIIPDQLSALVEKGEIVERYYNPGALFDDVHILLTNDDRPDPVAVQKLVGEAKLTFHNLPTGGRRLFARTLGWRPLLLGSWAGAAVALAREIKPLLIRCHGNGLNAFAALAIKRELGTPYVISLHGNPDVDYFRGRLGRTWQEKMIGRAIEAVEILTVQNADMVLPVYSPIVPYLKKHGVTRFEVVYNSVGQSIVPKSEYRLPEDGARILCVGRQQKDQKDPSNIIRAVASIPRARLTLIGDGDLHEDLKALARELGAGDRIRFVGKMLNSEILREMARSDMFVYCSINWEISKGCLEAALAGLPVVLNDRNGDPADELKVAPFVLVKDTAEHYRRAITDILADGSLREAIGNRTREHAITNWSPQATERHVSDIYRALMAAVDRTSE